MVKCALGKKIKEQRNINTVFSDIYWLVSLPLTITGLCKLLATLKQNQPWIFTGRTDAEAEAPIFWPPDAKSRLFGKDPDAGKDWGQKEKGATEDEMVEWHHQLSEHEFDQTRWDSEGQGSLVCCSLWACRVGHDSATWQQRTTPSLWKPHISFSFVWALNSLSLFVKMVYTFLSPATSLGFSLLLFEVSINT